MDNRKRCGFKIAAWVLVALFALVGCGKKEDCCCTNQQTAGVERSKDVVCGMWVEKVPAAIRANFDNADYYFCAEDCKQQFLKDTTRYAAKCRCASYKHDCKCEHCSGKRVPCDCK